MSQDEFVPVLVPVAHPGATGELASADSAIGPRDPCDMREPDIQTCTPVATVRAGEILGDARCFYDTRVQHDDVGRVLVCPGSHAMVVFDHARFAGTWTNGALNVCAVTTYDMPEGDRCTWRTEQRIHGSLSCGLGYSYSEAPVAGQSCALACRARGVLTTLEH
jgi:hypothetical protein